jgi:hypothetical protein
MKKIIYLLALILLFNNAKSQSVKDFGKISISVVMPNQTEFLDATQISKLEAKITQIVANSGLTSSGYNTFIIYPIFSINDVSVVESGMQDMSVATCELNLFIKQIDNNIIFSSVSKQLKGNGKDKKSAISSALQKISTNDPDYKKFIENGKQKIINYYQSNCNDIIKKSESLMKMQKYEEAIGVLMAIPEVITECYQKSSIKAAEVYKAYQNHNCASQIQLAKTNIANKNYTQALKTLAQIDPNSNCYKEAGSLVKSIESKISEEDKKQWDFMVTQYKDAVSLEKQRIDAVKEIATSYYKSQTKTINYNYIIR